MQIAEKKKYTVDDYLMLEEGAPFQLIDYELIMSPSPSLLHQLVLGEFYDTLKEHIKKIDPSGLVVLSPIDIHFDDGNVYQPDLIYITSATKGNIILDDKIQGAPDLVVEILSPSTGYYDLRFKKDVYEKFGVKEYIIIDPIRQEIEVYSWSAGAYTLHMKAHAKQTLSSKILPDLVIDLQKLFK